MLCRLSTVSQFSRSNASNFWQKKIEKTEKKEESAIRQNKRFNEDQRMRVSKTSKGKKNGDNFARLV